jgi:hypothetical protein
MVSSAITRTRSASALAWAVSSAPELSACRPPFDELLAPAVRCLLGNPGPPGDLHRLPLAQQAQHYLDTLLGAKGRFLVASVSPASGFKCDTYRYP